MDMKRITINRRYAAGIAAYQLAKLRMLELYYDCMGRHSQKSNWELLEMNTYSHLST
jgi:hypothetical protein